MATSFGDDGDDSRRRPPNWADWTHDGLPDMAEVEDDDDFNRDNPETWLMRAKKRTKRISGEHPFTREGVLLLYVLNMLRRAYKSGKNNT